MLGASPLVGCGGGTTGTTSGSTQSTGSGGGGGGAPAHPFVLVHGAFMGAWVWDDVRAGLEAKGGKVSVVELPAHGDDMTPVKDATLDAYVASVEKAVDAAGAPVTLVGHSMAGMVISAVAEDKPHQIAELVYLAAYLPGDGDSLQSLAATDTGSHLLPVLMIDAADGLAKLPVDKLEDIFCADCSASQVSAIKARYRDEPLAPLGTPVHLSNAAFGSVPKRYVYTKQDHAVSYPAQKGMTAGVKLEATATLDTSHSPFLSQPAEVVGVLLGH
jgi:pimeloyl-ACP methyl ester carboxylesterase